MIDEKSIASRIAMVEQCFKVLEGVREKGLRHYEAGLGTRLMAERALHVATEAVIDIGNHVIAVNGWRRPRDYASVSSRPASGLEKTSITAMPNPNSAASRIGSRI